MTAVVMVPREGGSPRGRAASVLACGFCRRRLGDEYFFTCRRCDASYCYIHMSRHQPALCARNVARRSTLAAPSPVPLQNEDVVESDSAQPRGGPPLVLASP